MTAVDTPYSYFKCRWFHADADFPVLLWSELDRDRNETRKIDIFADGRMQGAGHGFAMGDTRLGEVAVPPLAEINADPEFQAVEVARDAFEAVWTQAIAAGREK